MWTESSTIGDCTEDNPPFAAPFLDREPPRWAVQGLASLLIGLALCTILAAGAFRLPETVSSSFVLLPVQGADPVRSARDGLVERVQVREGQPVEDGDTLFVIRSEAVGDRSSELQTLETEREGVRASLANEQKQYGHRRRADREEVGRFERRIAQIQRILDLKRSQFELTEDLRKRYGTLYEKGWISYVEYANRQLQVKQAEVELERLETELAESQAGLAKTRHDMKASETQQQELERRLEERIETASARIAVLRNDLTQSTGSDLSIPAPCAGIVVRLHVQAVGTVVRSADVLAELACSAAPLQAELTVAQGGVARLEPGQGVKLLYDAFPYARYGVRYATLRWISPATVMIDGKRVFRALADLEDEVILVGGKPRSVKAGMRGQARVVVGRQTILSYALTPLRRLRESISGIPPKADDQTVAELATTSRIVQLDEDAVAGRVTGDAAVLASD